MTTLMNQASNINACMQQYMYAAIHVCIIDWIITCIDQMQSAVKSFIQGGSFLRSNLAPVLHPTTLLMSQ